MKKLLIPNMLSVFICLLIFSTLEASPVFVEYNMTRMSKIYLPKSNFTVVGELFKYRVFSCPFSNVKDYNSTTELCQKAKKDLISFDPSLWNSSFSNPCSKYFCEKEKGYNNSVLHYSAHRLCFQCHDSISENMKLEQNCSLIDKTCLNHCTKDSDCIYYDKDLTMCYNRDKNRFYYKDDLTHIHYLQFLGSLPFILISSSGISFILTVFLIIIPNIIKTFYDLKIRGLKWTEKLQIIFSLQNQTFFLLLICSPIFFIGSIVDIFISSIDGATFVNAIAFAVFINAAILLLAIISLIINWIHLIRLMDLNNNQDSGYLKYLGLHVFTILIFFALGISLVLIYGLYLLVDEGRRKVWIYITGVVVLIIFLIISFIVIVLFVLSIMVLNNLSKAQSQNENIFDLAIKLKVNSFIY